MDFSTEKIGAIDPYVKFSQAYSKKHFGVDLIEISLEATKAWENLTRNKRQQFRATNYEQENQSSDENESDSDNACGLSRNSGKIKSRSSKNRRSAQRKTCTSTKKTSVRRRQKTRARSAPKSKARVRRTKKQSKASLKEAPKKLKSAPKRKSRPKARCAPKRRSRGAKSKPDVTSSNGYLNFLRAYKKKNRGIQRKDLLMKAARAWGRLSKAKKNDFRRQSVRKPKPRACK